MSTRTPRGARLAMYLVLIFLAGLWLFPIGLALYKSIQVGGWNNYNVVLNSDVFNYWQAVGNSFLMAGAASLVIVVVSSLAGFAFSKLRFRGRNLIYALLLACLAVPVAAVVTPLFFSINYVGLRDSYLGVIIPLAAFNSLMMLLIMKNHFDSIPDEIMEAAALDGAGLFRTFSRILLPLSGPTLATVGTLSFVYSWNEFLLPNLLLRSAEKFPVTQAISLLEFNRMSLEQISQLYAGLILMTIPSVVVYLVAQRYLQAGVTAGAVKS